MSISCQDAELASLHNGSDAFKLYDVAVRYVIKLALFCFFNILQGLRVTMAGYLKKAGLCTWYVNSPVLLTVRCPNKSPQ